MKGFEIIYKKEHIKDAIEAILIFMVGVIIGGILL